MSRADDQRAIRAEELRVMERAFKEAAREFLADKFANDKQAISYGIEAFLQGVFATFGKWSLRSILAGALGVLTYALLTISGWHR